MTPQTQHKYVGIELEFSCPYDVVYMEEKLKEHNLYKYVEIDYDGRPFDGEESFEWKVLCKESEVVAIISKVGRLIDELGGRCNDSHGLHVHLDMRHRDKAQSFAALVLAQPVLFKLAHPRRKNSRFCRPQEHVDIEFYSDGHYGAINPKTSYDTIEVRIREGITNYHDIIRYIKFLIAIVNSKHTKQLKTMTDLQKTLTLSKVMKDYLTTKLKRKSA